MLFYGLGDNTSFERQWTYAWRIESRSHEVSWTCDDCGRADNYPAQAFDVFLEGGSDYPDFLMCGAYPLFIVSERVVSAFKNADILSFLEYPVQIAGIQDSRVKKELAPKYCRLELTGECRVDVVASGGRVRQICKRCGGFQTEPTVIKRFKLFEGSWDGSDLFRDHVFFPRVNFCTEKVAKLVRSADFTNARLDEMG